jgi:ABC-2 type transport system ATP-binding protein
MSNIIEINRLSRRYAATEAVHELTMAVPAGSIFALLGSNGAGKTTTIKVMMNLLAPTAGEARVFGIDSRRLGEAQFAQIGYVSENQQLPLWMTIRQLLDYCRPFYPTWDRELERMLLDQFDLPPDRKLRHLSRGMFVKTALLTSLAYRPKLLVLDEPFSGLDALVRDEFIRGVLEVSALSDWTVFISSHDIDEVERLADHVALIDQGRLRFSEAAEALLARFRKVAVTLQDNHANLEAPPPNWLELSREGNQVRFVESAYEPCAMTSACRQCFPGAAVDVQTMPLREIFLTLARTGRRAQKVSAA